MPARAPVRKRFNRLVEGTVRSPRHPVVFYCKKCGGQKDRSNVCPACKNQVKETNGVS